MGHAAVDPRGARGVPRRCGPTRSAIRPPRGRDRPNRRCLAARVARVARLHRLRRCHEASSEVLALFSFLPEILAEAPDLPMLVLTRRKLPFYDRRDVLIGGVVDQI